VPLAQLREKKAPSEAAETDEFNDKHKGKVEVR
jgi:hypothetical protein